MAPVVVEVVDGHVNGPQVNAQLMSPTSHCAILRESPMLQAPSPFTSPQRTAATVVVAVGEAALPEEAVASRKERERRAARSPRAGKRKASSFTHLPNGEQG